jgi:pyridoxamine 5'-phosphate oxidase
MSPGDVRRDYHGSPLEESEADTDPFRHFSRWFDEASGLETDPTAMTLATTTRDGRPSARMVLLKGADERGFVFYTNYESRKAEEIDATGRASLLFYWASLERQVRIEGAVARVSAEESDAYFATRPLESRWGVYASQQSRVIAARSVLDARVDAARHQFGEQVPRPDWWGGYRVVPDGIEFWQGRPSRLHDRLRFTRDGGAWRRDRLAP